MTIPQALQLALQRHQAGHLAEAQALYRQILSYQPTHADALHLLGAIALQTGAAQEAVDLVHRAISINPNIADYHVTYAVARDALNHLDESLVHFRRAAELEPNRPEVLSNLATALRKAGKLNESMEASRRALRHNPDHAAANLNLGVVLAERSNGAPPQLLDEAIGFLRKASALAPHDIQAKIHLALALGRKKQFTEAIELCRRAVAESPNSPDAHNALGSLLREVNQLEEAVVESRKALELRPNFFEGHLYLGLALRDLGKLEESAQSFRDALAMRPDHAEAHNALAHVLCMQNEFIASEAACRMALSLRPDFDEAANNLGMALQGQLRWEEAITAHQASLAMNPGFPETHNNLGIAYGATGQIDLAMQSLQKALALRPDYPSAHWNLALRLLAQGDYQRGWKEYEWRLRVKYFNVQREFPYPMWDGSDLNGKKILIHNEQGFGDTIQFLRFIPEVAARGGKVVLACQDGLRRLCERVNGVEKCIGMDNVDPECEVHCSLMSLPMVLGTTLQTIPSQMPYLSVDAKWKDKWSQRIPHDDRKNIGFLWANRPFPAGRCPASTAWSPLANVKNAWFCSLQKRDVGGEAQAAPPGFEITDWTDLLFDFADTAALIENLDLIITVDTAIAHLAGALAKPVWLLLKFAPDWRWMLDRADSPWYPTMRLFRQPNRTDWDTPIQQIADALQSP